MYIGLYLYYNDPRQNPASLLLYHRWLSTKTYESTIGLRLGKVDGLVDSEKVVILLYSIHLSRYKTSGVKYPRLPYMPDVFRLYITQSDRTTWICLPFSQ